MGAFSQLGILFAAAAVGALAPDASPADAQADGADSSHAAVPDASTDAATSASPKAAEPPPRKQKRGRPAQVAAADAAASTAPTAAPPPPAKKKRPPTRSKRSLSSSEPAFTSKPEPPAKKARRNAARQQRVAAANGTRDAHGGRIETCHLVMNTIWFLLITLEAELMRFYIIDEGLKLAERFVHDREGLGRDITSILSSHRLGAMGTSERGVAATFHSEERRRCMAQLLFALKGHDGRRYGSLTVLELERALFWGGLRFHAFKNTVLTAVVAAAGCYYGGLLALNVMAGGYATLELERRYAWHYRQSELRRMLYAGSLFDVDGNLNASLGAQELEIEVAQAGEDGRSATYSFGTREALIGIVAGLRLRAPNVSDQDKANGGVPYATTFVDNWGDEDGQRLMPGALGYTVYRVVDGKRTSRLFGRESWGLVLAAAVGLPVEGLEPLGIRGVYGYPSPLSPPVGSSERKKEGKKLRSLEQMAKEALVAEAGRSDGAAAAAEAVTAVVALCGKRHNTLDEEFAPRLAAARGAVLAACPALQKKLDAYVERSKILAMHDARAQVLGGKLGAVASAVAGLTPAQRVEYNEAVDLDNQPEIARLLGLGAAANGELSAVAGLTPAQRVEYDAAVASNNESDIARLLHDGAVANGELGAVAGAVAGLTASQAAEYEAAIAINNQGEIARLLHAGAVANGDLGAVACLDAERRDDFERACKEGQDDVKAELLKKAHSKLGTAGAVAQRKATGCKLQVTALTEQGLLGEVREFTASREMATSRFAIYSKAGGGAFGYSSFRLKVTDVLSGAKVDSLGTISVPFDVTFTIKHKSGRLFKCKFLEIIAAKNVAAACSDEEAAAGGDEEAE